MQPWNVFLPILTYIASVSASVTVYQQKALQFSTATAIQTSFAPGQSYTGLPAYNPTRLKAPALPQGDQTPALAFDVQLSPNNPQGISVVHDKPFYGFSVEMSVSVQLFGKNSSLIHVPFLNLVSNIVARSGELHIRVGGNTQESAALVESNPGGVVLSKNYDVVSGTTNTPPIDYTIELLYMMGNISSMVKAKWYLGIPFNDTNFRMAIVEHGHAILGDNLIGLQAGNEPDFYPGRRRPANYTPFDYFGEVGDLINLMKDTKYDGTRNLLIVPSVSIAWDINEVWKTQILETYRDNLAYVAMERYPTDNCFATFGVGTPRSGQDMLPYYLNHGNIISLVQEYSTIANYALTLNKPFIMFETNTASCGGFAGISNAFGGALWAVDYGLQLASGNVSGALLHFGGQSTFYNPFTAPPTGISSFAKWSVGAVYYSILIVAEALGKNNKAQIMDMKINNGNPFTPAYAIYEDNVPARVVLMNYMDDPTGAHNVTASLFIAGGNLNSVRIKWFSAPSVTELSDIKWANQTFGPVFSSDGIPVGVEAADTMQCTNGVCKVTVPAPGLALVFLNDVAFDESGGTTLSAQTYSTTAVTKTRNTAYMDPTVIATSNGNKGLGESRLGSTSPQKNDSVSRVQLKGFAILSVALIFGFSMTLGLRRAL